MRSALLAAFLISLPASGDAFSQERFTPDEWTDAQFLSASDLYLVPDPTNHVADDPAAAAFGKILFNSTQLSLSGKTACATCHDAKRDFQDDLTHPVGKSGVMRKTPSLAGAGFSPWYSWDGRKDSLWSQALAPLVDANEHNLTRLQAVKIVTTQFRADYEKLFGPVPQVDRTDAAFANIGKAIAAYIRTIPPTPNRFDTIVQNMRQTGSRTPDMTQTELEGFKLFRDKAGCFGCHAGPLLTNDRFHNTGVPQAANTQKDEGRAGVLTLIDADPFRCGSDYADANGEACDHLTYASRNPAELRGAFKTPTLRGISRRTLFMHDGSLHSLDEVINHYDQGPAATIGTSELKSIGLTAKEKADLRAFLEML
jgi:cytochrome c peroxidase